MGAKPENYVRALSSQSLQNRTLANQINMEAGKSVDPIHAAGPAGILALLAVSSVERQTHQVVVGECK